IYFLSIVFTLWDVLKVILWFLDKLQIIGRVYRHNFVFGIRIPKGFTEFSLFIHIPFEIISVQNSIVIFNEIYFLLRLVPPKIIIGKKFIVRFVLQPLHNQEVFP